jgi:hypothetical protein
LPSPTSAPSSAADTPVRAPRPDDVDESSDTPRRRRGRNRVTLAVLGIVAIAIGIGGVLIATQEPPPPPPKPDIPLDAWAPYWTLDASLPEADRRLGSLRDVSPFWFSATGVTDIVVDPSANPERGALLDGKRRALDRRCHARRGDGRRVGRPRHPLPARRCDRRVRR